MSDGIGEKETKVGTKTEKESPWAGWVKEEKIYREMGLDKVSKTL